MTIVPPGRSDRIECDQVARPTVSITASTFTGSRSPDSKTSWAPMLERPRALGLVAAGGEHPQPAGPGQRDQRGRHAAAGALHEHACRRP